MIIFSELSCANITASSCAFGASLAITVVNVTVTVASDVLPTVSLIRYVKVSVPVWFKVGVYSIEVPFTTTAVPVPEEIISSESGEAAPFDPKLSLSNTSIVTAAELPSNISIASSAAVGASISVTVIATCAMEEAPVVSVII